MSSRAPADALSGPHWLDVFPGHTSYEDLESDFKETVLEFKDALASAKIVPNDIDLSSIDLKTLDTNRLQAQVIRPTVVSTFRPRERCYLMHWAWLIYYEHLSNEVFNPPAESSQRIKLSDSWSHFFVQRQIRRRTIGRPDCRIGIYA